ncbi:MAG: hypothetical protein JOS17DRAFT_172163 [Linnemannia elongata]|nr:MAG: hypothetical protein JOS17DRAFT_172163 [Linnemannia elongata]
MAARYFCHLFLSLFFLHNHPLTYTLIAFFPLLLHQHDISTMSPRLPPHFDPLIHPDIVDNIIPYLLLNDDNPRFLARAALINKSWNSLYTPFLWRNIKVDNNNFENVPELFQRYGVYVRQLTVSGLTETMFDIITALCPFVEAVMFSCPEVSIQRLILYLNTLKATLRRVSLGMMTVPPEDIVSALVNDAGGGSEGYSKLKSWRLTLDPAVKDTKSLRWNSVVRLMEAHAHVDKLQLANVHVLNPDFGSHDQGQDHQTAATEEVKDTDRCHALRNPHPLEQQHRTTTKITTLNFTRVEMDDRRVIDLLGMTPQLTTFLIGYNKAVKGDFLVALLMLCPEVRKLGVQCCGSIPSSAFSRFFQSLAASSHNNQSQQQQQQDFPSVQLERLLLVRCKLTDQSLEHLATSQASTLLHLHLCKCSGVTDSGLKAVLSRCHRLESLALVGIVGPTLAIMTDDNDANYNNINTDLGATLLTTDLEKRQKWACYMTLKQLDIRKFGLQHPGHVLLEAGNPQNRAAFRRIRERIRMLPALERLAVSVWGADEELLQGFMGIEDDDQGHQARQLPVEGENEESEVVNANTDQTEAEALAAVQTPTTDIAESEEAGSPPHQIQHNNQVARALVGPRLRNLKVYGQQGKTFLGSDLDRFIRNYPGLRELYTSTVTLDKQAVDRLQESGIEALSR